MSKTWVNGETITDTELNRIEQEADSTRYELEGLRVDLLDKVSSENFNLTVEDLDGRIVALENATESDPIYSADKPDIVSGLALAYSALQEETDPVYLSNKPTIDAGVALATTAVQPSALNSYYTKTQTDSWTSWESAYRGNTANLAISGTEIDITSYLGSLAHTSFGNAPIVYDSANNRFMANANNKQYMFVINYRLSGNLSGSDNSITIWRLNLKRASDNSLITYKTFSKDSSAPTAMVNEDMISFITRVYGDTDPFVTGGFKLSIQRIAGTQTLTLSGNQQLYFMH